MARLNPTSKIKIDKKDFVSIDVSKYKRSVKYGQLGSEVDGIVSKLNHRTEYDYNDKEHPYSYINETANGQNGDWDTDQFIDRTSTEEGAINVNSYRNAIEIGAAVGEGSRSLNGDINRDTLHKNGDITGNEFRYNAGNYDYILREYDDSDLEKSQNKGLYQYSDGSIEGGIKVDGGADAYNTSNTMLKTMNAYSVTVKPMDARDI